MDPAPAGIASLGASHRRRTRVRSYVPQAWDGPGAAGDGTAIDPGPRDASFQKSPTTLPWASMSTPSPAGREGRPGIVRMSPQ